MNEDRFESLLKESLRKNAEINLSPEFHEKLRSRFNRRNQISLWKGLLQQWLLAALVGFVGILLLAIYADLIPAFSSLIPYAPGVLILFFLFQALDQRILLKRNAQGTRSN